MYKAENYSLANLNAFRFEHAAKLYFEVQSETELVEFALAETSSKTIDSAPIVFGEGSNTILSRDVDEPVLRFTGSRIDIKPIPNENCVYVYVQAGKNWHELVTETLAAGLQGLENLSLIPGTAGAAPVQNIGAYGVELSDVLINVTALHWSTKKTQVLQRDECQFGYRDSLFKRQPGKYIITGITLKLNTVANLVTTYAPLKVSLLERKLANPTASDISDIVCEIRRSKLPNPEIIPNAGSFFKNPLVTEEVYERLASHYPDLPAYPVDPNHVKIAAGWLIEKAGLKGYQHSSGNVAVHDKQALVLVNIGGGSAFELFELAQHVKTIIQDRFGLILEREPVIV